MTCQGHDALRVYAEAVATWRHLAERNIENSTVRFQFLLSIILWNFFWVLYRHVKSIFTWNLCCTDTSQVKNPSSKESAQQHYVNCKEAPECRLCLFKFYIQLLSGLAWVFIALSWRVSGSREVRHPLTPLHTLIYINHDCIVLLQITFLNITYFNFPFLNITCTTNKFPNIN